MHTIIWSNGHTDRAETWQGLMDLVRADQWREYDEQTFRAEMAKRALIWNGTEIDMGAPPKRFFEELERAKLIQIERSK